MAKTYSTQEILKDPANMKAWMFGHTLTEVLKEEMDDVKVTPMFMESDFIKAAYQGKSWRKDYSQHLRMVIESPEFKLDINALNETTVDLFTIVVKNKKQGIGNELMLRIMAVADELDTDISLVPVAMSSSDNLTKAEKAAKWLRDWYDCMRFSECEDSPEMIYHAGWSWKSILGDHYGRLNLKTS
jgi:hypothetical protein